MTEQDQLPGCSLMNEIKIVEQAINTCYDRVYLLKVKLKSGSLSEDQQETLRQELAEVEKLLATNKKILKNIHKKNRSTFYFASALCLIIFMVWMLYHLAFGNV